MKNEGRQEFGIIQQLLPQQAVKAEDDADVSPVNTLVCGMAARTGC